MFIQKQFIPSLQIALTNLDWIYQSLKAKRKEEVSYVHLRWTYDSSEKWQQVARENIDKHRNLGLIKRQTVPWTDFEGVIVLTQDRIIIDIKKN